MRKLQAKDLFEFSRLVKQIGIKEELKSVCMNSNTMQDVYESGFEILYGIFDKATEQQAEKKLFEFFSKVFEMPMEEVEEMDPVEFINAILQVANVEKWKSFFLCGSFFEGVELKELLLRRYHSLDFVNDMELMEFLEFIQLAREKDLEERLYQQWCAMLPEFAEYIVFEEFKDMMTGKKVDMRPAEEIMDEIKTLHAKEGESNGTRDI